MAIAEPCAHQLQRQLPRPLSYYRTVAVVRNPWDWVVSGYLHVTQNAPAYLSPPTFRDFVKGAWRHATELQYPAKFKNPEAYVAYHTQITQLDHLCAGGKMTDIDTICRFESLESDVQRVFGLGMILPHVNKSDRGSYVVYYDEETMLAVAQRNAPLIERFGYEFVST
jgi:lipase chaperone LimK